MRFVNKTKTYYAKKQSMVISFLYDPQPSTCTISIQQEYSFNYLADGLLQPCYMPPELSNVQYNSTSVEATFTQTPDSINKIQSCTAFNYATSFLKTSFTDISIIVCTLSFILRCQYYLASHPNYWEQMLSTNLLKIICDPSFSKYLPNIYKLAFWLSEHCD